MVFNLGNNKPITLEYFIKVIEGKKAQKNLMPIQPGDVPKTYADINKTKQLLGWQPKTEIEMGVKKFIEWYLDYYLSQKSKIKSQK